MSGDSDRNSRVSLVREIERLQSENKTLFGEHRIAMRLLGENTATLEAVTTERDALRIQVERKNADGHHKLDTDRQVFFYEQDFYVLSNFSAFNLRWLGRLFPTSEHAYHWTKFAGGASHQPEIQNLILFSPSAHEAFKIAEKYKASRRTDWDHVKINVMHNILVAKVEQHEYVRRKLLATGDRELIEDSWRDDYWGWGPNRDGQNMLGKLWMEVRNELRASAVTSDERT